MSEESIAAMEEIQEDAFEPLDHDVTVQILMCLDDLGDTARACSVSRSWRDLIISNAVCKHLCIKMFPQLSGIIDAVDSSEKMEKPAEAGCSNSKMSPQLSGIIDAVDSSDKMEKPAEAGCSNSKEGEQSKKEHRIYASLARQLMSFEPVGCISTAICASSTDNFPEEIILNTLDPRDRVGHRTSYWSSSGQSDPSVPEFLTYKLVSNFCVVSEIQIQPFEAYFQPNSPIYAAKAVRFRMGHQIVHDDCDRDMLHTNSNKTVDDKFVWTYTSPEFPMTKDSTLQHFKLPHPVVCIGGILQIELIGRVEIQETDGLFYICITHVQVLGRSLSPVFEAEVVQPSGRFRLTYNHQAQFSSPGPSEDSDETLLASLSPQILQRHVRGWEQILNLLRGNMGVEVILSDDEQHESDEEFF